MLTSTLKKLTGIAGAAALAFTATACDGDQPFGFKPGHYVAGAPIGTNMGSDSDPVFSQLDYGLLDFDIAADGTITGSYQILNGYFIDEPAALPDFYSDILEFPVTGKATAYEFTMEIDADYIGAQFSGTGEVTNDGQIAGFLVAPCEGMCLDDYLIALGGIEVGDTEVDIACGGMGFDITDETGGSASAMFLYNEENLYAGFVGPQFVGSLIAPLSLDTCMSSIEGCGEGSGTVLLKGKTEDGSLDEALDVEFGGEAVDAPFGTDFGVEGGGYNDDYNIGFGGDTGNCFEEEEET